MPFRKSLEFPLNLFTAVERNYRESFLNEGHPEIFPENCSLSIKQKNFLIEVFLNNLFNIEKLTTNTTIINTDLEEIVAKKHIYEHAPISQLAKELNCSKQNLSFVKIRIFKKLTESLRKSIYWADHLSVFNDSSNFESDEATYFVGADTVSSRSIIDNPDEINSLPSRI